MESLKPLRPQLMDQISQIRSPTTRLSLMSVVITNLSQHAAASAVLAAASVNDAIGLLEDGSIGVFAIRGSNDPDGGGGVEERFLLRLRASLHSAFSSNASFKDCVWIRSAHRWASEIFNADELINALLGGRAHAVNLDLARRSPLLTAKRTRWTHFSKQVPTI